GQLACFEWRDAAVREGLNLRTVVGGEHHDGIVLLPHVFELLEDVSDVVVHLLHAGFVHAPVLAALGTYHVHILVRQHGGDVHASRVVPDEEGLVSLLGIIAVEEVNHVRGDFLVYRFRALERERTFILARLVLRRAVGGLHPKDRARRGHACAGFRVNTAGGIRDPRDGNRCGWRHEGLRRGDGGC